MYIYDEIQEFHVLELRIKTNVYVPCSFLAQSRKRESTPEWGFEPAKELQGKYTFISCDHPQTTFKDDYYAK